jgi:ADP-dependent NAD(P)H-hydrate dehydratase / NAD(P)H-hydrate epimerase
MTELLTTAQMRSIETAAITAGRVTGAALMECAGRGVVEAVFTTWPRLRSGALRAVVLCGPGNNGGDGFVIARLLRDEGWQVAVFAIGETTTPDAAMMRARWGEVRPLEALQWDDLTGVDLVVDAVFGIGLARDVPPGVWGALSMAQDSRCRIVAVDILSGICADSGRVRSSSGYLDRPVGLTVTFQAAKPGHHLDAGAQLGGALAIVPLGLDREMDALLRQDDAAVVSLAGPSGIDAKGVGHKYDHGHVLVLAGGPGRGGAGRLAARGALRVGAGLVTVACPPDALAENAARLDAIMLRTLADADALTRIVQDKRLTTLCLGPGLGLGAQTRDLVAVALNSGAGVVLDADALTSFAGDSEALFSQLHDGCVLTPHGGEFARLFPDLAAGLEAAPAAGAPALSKIDATRAAAKTAGCVVLFKGPDTVIAAPDGRCVVSSAHRDRAVPWLATAGSGDVLSGFIAGFMARGLSPLRATEAAAWMHVACALQFGPGLIAEDLPEQAPMVFRQLGL